MLTHFYEWRTYYDCSAFTISNGALVGWIIYGYVLFYSENNDCDKNQDTSFLASLMFVILFVGYILIAVYAMLLCTVPCMYAMLNEGASTRAN